MRIRNVDTSDLASYVCVAKNSLGETKGTIRLLQDTSASASSTSTNRQREQHSTANQINYYTGQVNWINCRALTNFYLNLLYLLTYLLTFLLFILFSPSPIPGASAKSNHNKEWPGKSNTTLDTSLASLPSSSSFPSSSSHSHGCSYVPSPLSFVIFYPLLLLHWWKGTLGGQEGMEKRSQEI